MRHGLRSELWLVAFVIKPGSRLFTLTIENIRPNSRVLSMAGVVGLEPTNGGTRTRCLTTWRHPKLILLYHEILKNAIMVMLWRKRKIHSQKMNY